MPSSMCALRDMCAPEQRDESGSLHRQEAVSAFTVFSHQSLTGCPVVQALSRV